MYVDWRTACAPSKSIGKVEQRLATLERLHLPNPADN